MEIKPLESSVSPIRANLVNRRPTHLVAPLAPSLVKTIRSQIRELEEESFSSPNLQVQVLDLACSNLLELRTLRMLQVVELVLVKTSRIQEAQVARQVSLVKTMRMHQDSNQIRLQVCLGNLSSQPRQALVVLPPYSPLEMLNSRSQLQLVSSDRLLQRARPVYSVRVKARLLHPQPLAILFS